MKPIRQIIILTLALLTTLASAQTNTPSEQLTQLVGHLQKSPTDKVLREKIIKLALEVKPAPTVPPEAKRPFVMGVTYQKEAKSPEDFGLAIKAFQDASAAAPWWGDAYYNLSVALESAKRYDEAKDALTLYLLTKPTDAEQAQERLYALDAKKVLAGKQQAEAEKMKSELVAKETAAAAAKQQSAATAEERKKNSIEGYWGVASEERPSFGIERVGDALIVKSTRTEDSYSDVQITKTSLSMAVVFSFPSFTSRARYLLNLRDGALYGTLTYGGDSDPTPINLRLIRKPWPAK